MKKVLFYILFLFTIQQVLFAQDASEAVGKTISDIRMNGLVNYKATEFKGIFSSYIGRAFDFDLLTRIETDLFATGYFSSVEAFADQVSDPGNLILVFNVVEIPLIQEIRFRGGARFKGKFTDHIDIKAKEPFSRARIFSSERRLRQALIDAGFVDATVSVEDSQLSNGNYIITFVITEGIIQIVEEIRFQGLDEFFQADRGRERRLRNALSQQPKKILKKGIYQATLVENDRQIILSYLQMNGYLDAIVSPNTIIDHRLDEDKGTDYLTITYVVEPGDIWLFGGVTITGNTLYTTEELLKVFELFPIGEVLDYNSFIQTFEYVFKGIYNRDGYAYNQYQIVQDRNQETKEIIFTIYIQEMDRAHIESITFTGNTKTRDNVIQRELEFNVGDIYSSAKLERSFRNLMQTGYFEGIIPSVNNGSDAGLVHVGFDVQEGRTTELMFGLNIGGNVGDFPISGMLGYGDNNLFGRGYVGKIDLQANANQISATARFFNPRFLDTRWGLGGNAGYVWNKGITRQGWDDIPHNQSGGYVFRATTEYEGVSYPAGSYFPVNRPPTFEEISTYGLIPDYQFFPSNIAPMVFQQHEMRFGVSTGYIQPLPVGALRFTTGFDFWWTYTTYDEHVRPALNEISDGYRRWVFGDALWANVAWENRNNIQTPTDGFVLSQSMMVSGGVLGGQRTFLKSQTRFDYYLPLPEVKFSKKENAWSMRWNIKFRTAFSWLGAQGRFGLVGAADQWFRLDGMFFGRGWGDLSPAGRLLWDNSVEFRLPLLGNLLWWDTFIDMIWLWEDERFLIQDNAMRRGFYGAIGTGFRVAIPSFPIAIYLIKRFRVNDAGSPEGFFNWNPGLAPTWRGPGLDLAIVFSIDMY
ncbi:outer membrane protein assembly factor BamA [Entomospira culicis]|uniref:Outer membrane protein assembly factor BamA n=1 Tax=Entomospira culicis TaxID=2719989 RepID=A0A968GI85_9SPIO|nr:outer membrane protein assembly factor BamA [Entomospira culicis]NIZ19568.1 outer membrane protein assembly factor BamA [Entomospira culicis]NIZ69527.1 outer membrane protein assembly factor BamA [Entomospira culicis]WDI36640.1 outer membrane protein assembly factor BamA [Entomospira culicis]WDI38269.1 outer membrane protein assembly factor BamA [Entomospira culicis]